MNAPLRIGVAGLGTVGTALIRLIGRHDNDLAVRCGRAITVTGVSARDRRKDRGVDLSGATWFDDVLVCHRPLMATEVAALYGCYAGRTETDPAELPFVSSREVQLQAYVNFTRGQLLVDADCRGARKDLAGRPARVALT
ncbi:MAG: hypothetical protein K8F58_00250, partial [Bauldia sp.]|nr:hypothetical protein [Bauldia sp.]